MFNKEKDIKSISYLAGLGILLIALVTVSGCSNTGIEPGKGLSEKIETDDDLLLKINEQLPGFGGMFYDEKGQLNVYIVNLSSTLKSTENRKSIIGKIKSNAETAIVKIYGKERLKSGSGIETATTGKKPGKLKSLPIKLISGLHNIRQLIKWRTSTIALLKNKNVVFSDTDEVRNKITIGVLNEKTRQEVYRYFKKRNIPKSAINIEISEPFVESQKLTDRIRPVVAGVEMHIPGELICTLGVNAYRQVYPNKHDIHQRGFLTNSHCTKRFGAVDNNDRAFQPNVGATTPNLPDPRFLGYEIVDPRRKKCYIFVKCRYSDAAFIRYVTNNWTLGKIARPFTENTGNLEIDPMFPEFSIVAEEHNAIVGEYLHKVGRTTGWTSGSLSRTCIDRFNGFLGTLLRCQHVVKASIRIAGGGDSGSPVFRRHAGSGNPNVTFYGLMWGSKDGGKKFIFSSIKYLEKEFNDLHVAVGSEPPEPTFPSCPTGQKCCWINNKTGNCFCVPDKQKCPTNPLGDCPSGQVCCVPGLDRCKTCAQRLQDCGEPP